MIQSGGHVDLAHEATERLATDGDFRKQSFDRN